MTWVAKSLPWSRLKPRRKYWLALPSPECWVTIMPGTVSSASAGRSSGQLASCLAVTVPSVARIGDAGQLMLAAADGDFLQGRRAGGMHSADAGQGGERSGENQGYFMVKLHRTTARIPADGPLHSLPHGAGSTKQQAGLRAGKS